MTIVYRGPRLLRKEDDEISARFWEVYLRQFDTVLNSAIQRVRRQGDEIVVETASDGVKRSIMADTLLLAVGRVPNTDTLDVAKSGVTVDANGFVKTDEYLETSVPGIWALGDIVGRYLLSSARIWREANERGTAYAVGRYSYIDTAYGSSIDDKDGFEKVLVHRKTGEVLGGHIIGSEASILAQEIANAMRGSAGGDALLVHLRP